ncbi:hypothetical protein [Ekhidna sp. To15]|uniref:hypothetical protein n=1 Tax=Ekhidna sp. To15 TaxID=3395267 RepID=UPI003F528C8E
MRKILITAMLVSTLATFGQNVTLSDNQLSANILPLTLSYERKIDENKSFTFSGGIAATAYAETGSNGSNSYFFATPYLTSSIRNYYSRKNIKKSNLRNNSGNYVALYYQHQFEPFGSTTDPLEQAARNQVSNVFAIGPVWGFERNYASGIHLGLSIGVGYSNGEFQKSGEVTFIGEFEFGFVLFSK